MHILTIGLSIYLVGEDCKEDIKRRKRKNREKLVSFNKWQQPWIFTNFSQSYSYRTELNHVLKGTNAFSHIYCTKFHRLANPLKQKHYFKESFFYASMPPDAHHQINAKARAMPQCSQTHHPATDKIKMWRWFGGERTLVRSELQKTLQ